MTRLAWLAALSLLGCHRRDDDSSPAVDARDVTIDASTTCSDTQLAALEQQMATMLDAAATNNAITTNPDFTVLLETDDGRRFTHSHGASTPTTRYESASTSKWVTAVVILDLVDSGELSLATTAGSLLQFWNEDAVDLRDLLSFTSGFGDEPPCLNLPNATFATCVQTIYSNNAPTAAAPGTEYEYGPTHLQVAGLMAMRATQKTSWTQVFAAWKAKTGLFPTGVYDVPSTTNPRIASGMHWTGEEYLGFLRALAHDELLAPATMQQLHANQRGTADVVYSPLWDEVHEDWSYGLGNWVECPTATTEGGYNCTGLHRNSSAGAYGAYPFVDADHHYFGLVARQGNVMSAGEGVAIFRVIEDLATRWADRECD